MKSLLLAIELALNIGYRFGETYQSIPTPITSILIFRLWLRGIVSIDSASGYFLFAERQGKWWQISNEEVFYSLFMDGKMLFHRRIKEDVVRQILDKGVGVTAEDIAYSVMFERGNMTLSPYQWYILRKNYGAFHFVSVFIFLISAAVILT